VRSSVAVVTSAATFERKIMLDSHYYKSESKVVAVTKEIEKTITPDKVTEMYDKVRAQTEHDVIASLRVDSNLLNGVAVQIIDEFSTATSRLHTRFIINGKEYEDTIILEVEGALTPEQMYERLTQHYLGQLTKILFRDITPIFAPAFFKK
jgi:hypothetical protein